jgi:hypothetical protein
MPDAPENAARRCGGADPHTGHESGPVRLPGAILGCSGAAADGSHPIRYGDSG